MRFLHLLLPLLLALPAAAEQAPDYRFTPEAQATWLQSAAATRAALNRERQRHGLAELAANDKLDRAAQAHADHLARHRRATHQQLPEEAGFVGSMPWDRTRAQGYGLGQTGVVAEAFVVGIADVDAALMQLLSGPYHRHILLSARAAEVGVGLSAQPGLVLEFGSAKPTVKVQRFELHEEPSGRPIETLLLQADNDPHLKLHRNLAYIVPRLPLLAGARYRVHFVGEAGAERLERSWTFDTAAE